jgi:cytochrome c553
MNSRKTLRWIGTSLGAVLALAMLAMATAYVVIGRDLSRKFDIPLTEIDVPDDPASIVEGERLARIRGCFGGCHGDTVAGSVFFEVPDGTQMFAPDLAGAAQKYSAAELARLVRHGVRPDGTSVLLPMPSRVFFHLSDHDLGLIIAYLKSQAPREQALPDTRFGPLGRTMLLYFKQEEGSILVADLIKHDLPRSEAAPDNPEEYGKYLAVTSCAECHGPELQGWPDDNVPPLTIVAAYSLADFTVLLRTGTPIGGRELGLMAEVSTAAFTHFTDAEIAALHAYLRTLLNS